MENESNIPIMIFKNYAAFLEEHWVQNTKQLGFNHKSDIPYRVMFAQDGDIIFQPWKEPNIIYHYCNSESFKAILQNKTLRMYDARFCNDKMELIQFPKIFSESLNEAINQVTDKNLDSIESKIPYYKTIYPADIVNQIEQEIKEIKSRSIEQIINVLKQKMKETQNWIFAELSNSITNQNPIYISCFCEQGDVKSQWMEYAAKGTGVAIGFNVEHIKTLKNVDFRRILYYKNETAELIDKVIPDHFVNTENVKYWYPKIFPIIKHEMWKEEKEWRLIYLPSQTGENYPLKQDSNSQKLFYELPFQSEFISKIILGPDCELNENECIEMLKNEFGIHLNKDQVVKSELPYQSSKNK